MTPEQERQLAGLAAEHLGPAADDYVELLGRFEAAHPHAEPHGEFSYPGGGPVVTTMWRPAR
jgi:hypothetical protein